MLVFSWYSTVMLAFEAGAVVNARLAKIAMGGTGASSECQLMVMEKIGACLETGSILASGGSTEHVIDNYRRHVAANASRLR
jgi:hypothetical protein